MEYNIVVYRCKWFHLTPYGSTCVGPQLCWARNVSHCTLLHIELQHSLNITASKPNPVVVGATLTLTCVAVSNRAATLQWIDENGDEIPSGNGIDVSASLTHEVTSTITLTFAYAKTTDSGTYTCKCVVDELSSFETTTYTVTIQSQCSIYTSKDL